MKFVKAKDNEDLFFRHVSDDGKLEIGIWRVLFGFRIRCGFVGEGYCCLEYCCGDSEDLVAKMFHTLKVAVEKVNPQTPVDFDEAFPVQSKKPIFLDPECFKAIVVLAGVGGWPTAFGVVPDTDDSLPDAKKISTNTNGEPWTIDGFKKWALHGFQNHLVLTIPMKHMDPS